MNDTDQARLDDGFGSSDPADWFEDLSDHDAECGLRRDEGGCTCPDTPRETVTTAEDLRRNRAYPYQARQVRPGWWLRFSGTYDPQTGDVDFTPRWVEVASVETLDPDSDDRTVIRRRVTYTNGEHDDAMATATVYALTARQAEAAGLTGKESER